MSATVASPFGRRLREWRRLRGLSQLDLASHAATTTRHVSFIETGRSRPSRDMVLRLSEALEVPLRGRNELLEAAGLAPAFPHREISSTELAPYRASIQQLLDAHDPYPGLVLDPRWRVLVANAGACRLFGDDVAGASIVEWMLADESRLENWSDTAWAALGRLRLQLRENPADDELRQLVSLAEAYLRDVPRPAIDDLVVCPRFRVDDRVVATIGMAARFATPSEITLDELRVELFFPADAAAEAYFRG